ncbi:hypothetical protein B296_00000177 [Ensete ventricosum]|uniref:Uncharacterized protein n=1 Tax=Ensete ventricosum TaxID=4639 RepID=A0A426YEU9_ENSVE|nr:hypothetical protein B296_00000177 [Ensete ventricosum]
MREGRSPVEAAARRRPPTGTTGWRQPSAGKAACKWPTRRGGRPLAGRLPTCKGSHRLCRGDDSVAMRVREEARASF